MAEVVTVVTEEVTAYANACLLYASLWFDSDQRQAYLRLLRAPRPSSCSMGGLQTTPRQFDSGVLHPRGARGDFSRAGVSQTVIHIPRNSLLGLGADVLAMQRLWLHKQEIERIAQAQAS